MTAVSDEPITAQDVYVPVQQVNTRTAELMLQVNAMALHAREERREAQEDREYLLGEIARLRRGMYAALCAAGVLVLLLQLASVSGR